MLGIPLALITIADLGKFVAMAVVRAYDIVKDFTIRVNAKLRMDGFIQQMGPKSQAEDKIMLKDDDLELTTRSSEDHKLDTDPERPHNIQIISPAEEKSDSVKMGGGLDDFEFEEEHMPVPPLYILMVLFAYTLVGATFYCISEDWEFQDAFYFCFITMTTIGFGDLVPSDEKAYILLITVIYIVFGLVLTTMTVDMVGSHYIKKMHYMGRKLDDAKAALALLSGKAGNMGQLLGELKILQKKYGLSDADMERILMNADTMFTVPPLPQPGANIYPFSPDDASFMSWIDRTDDGSAMSFCGFTRFTPLLRHISRIPEVHEFDRPDRGRTNKTITDVGDNGSMQDRNNNYGEVKF